MTRWARVGNSQKHKKLPEDATPWKDFWQNKNSAGNANKNKVMSGRVEKAKEKQKKKFGFDGKRKTLENPENQSFSKFKKAKQEKNEDNYDSPKFSTKNEMNQDHSNIKVSSDVQGLSKKKLKKARMKAKLQQLKNTESNDIEDNSISNNAHSAEVYHTDNKSTNGKYFQGTKKELKKARNKAKLQQLKDTESSGMEDNSISNNAHSAEVSHSDDKSTNGKYFQGSKKELKKARKKAKLQQLKDTESNDMENNSISNNAHSVEGSHTNNKVANEKDFQGKKKLFMQKLEKRRKENGILLLSAKVERKLYIIKRRLREKGLPAAAIKDIARKERRKEEIKFRQSMSTKPCFNCRQTGHLLAECPVRLGNSNQETGICFKCGSVEHTSYKCPEKIKGYPLAKCFVCKEQGHISRDCPKNEHGVYIKGGKCNLCGNVNHLRKDCPTLKTKNDEEADITAYTIDEEKSVDAEIIPTDDVRKDMRTSIKKGKKAKLVKF